MKEKRGFRPKRARGSDPADAGQLYLYGLHPVRAALANPQRAKHTLYATSNGLRKLEDGDVEISARVKHVTPEQLNRMLGREAVHQGVALHVRPLQRHALSSLTKDARLLLILDQVTDPHNVGAILRSACGFGADALITLSRFSPSETGVLAKSASGALDWTPLVEVRNLANTIIELQDAGFTCVGLDAQADRILKPGALDGKLAIVLGAEGKGLRQRTRATCDQLFRLDMPGPINALNVSNAAAIALFVATSG